MACDSPLTVYPKEYDHPSLSTPTNYNKSYPVPCGKCPPCKKTRVAGWRFRMLQEEKVAMQVHFITLTYDTQYVPITENGFMTLNPEHLTKFYKQLRIKQHRQKNKPQIWPKIKYYSCGEYGEIKSRPHYHIILFNIYDVMDIPKSWQKGRVDVQTSPKAGSFAYTAGYIDKEKRIPLHDRDDRVKEFSRISQKLGVSYIEDKQNVAWHLADIEGRAYVSEGAKKLPMPRYYKEKIYTKAQRQRIAINAEKYQLEQEIKILKSYPSVEIHKNNQKAGRYANYYHHKKTRE